MKSWRKGEGKGKKEKRKNCDSCGCYSSKHLFSTYTKVSEKLTFLTPWYAQLSVSIMGLEMLVFQKILHACKMDGSPSVTSQENVLSLISD